MEKKSYKLITVIGILKIMFGIIGYLPLIALYVLAYFDTPTPKPPLVANIIMGSVGLFFIIYAINGINILRLKNNGRKLSVALDIITLLIYLLFRIPQRILSAFDDFLYYKDFREAPWYIFELLLFILPIWFIYYLTRTKVKERFK